MVEPDNRFLSNYATFSNGGPVYPKEKLEIFSEGSVLRLDDFRSLTGFGWKGFNKMRTITQNGMFFMQKPMQ